MNCDFFFINQVLRFLIRLGVLPKNILYSYDLSMSISIINNMSRQSLKLITDVLNSGLFTLITMCNPKNFIIFIVNTECF